MKFDPNAVEEKKDFPVLKGEIMSLKSRMRLIRSQRPAV